MRPILAAAAALLLAIPAAAQHSSWTMPLFTGTESSPEFSAGELSLMIRVLDPSLTITPWLAEGDTFYWHGDAF